ncbi:MAG: sodium-dependent transporter [Lachnospiraceae bacterium]|nr:sodium-dependent transporter [Lachnospiraceae bacterium]
MEKRERLGSRLGFILLSAGCAIGLGNVWKFPYYTGQYGGGIFVLFYIIFLILFGIPVMTMEFSLGRAAQKSPVMMIQKLEKPGQKWHVQGFFAFAGNILLMMYYTVIAGWILKYFIGFIKGDFTGMDTDAVTGYFVNNTMGSVSTSLIFTIIMVAIGFFVCSFSLQKGLERVTKIMMIILLALMVVLAVHSLTMKGASAGLEFYLKPDFAKFSWETVNKAMNQAFFTLSLGIGSMAIFGSYLGKDRSLLGESINVTILDTVVAVMAGLIIFPACFTFDINPGAGPGLLFMTLPNVFINMPGGRIWGTLFFLFMTFAALSTVLAVFENILSMFRDLTGWSRPKACILLGVALAVLSIPCALGFNVWAGFHPFAADSGVLDLEDFIVSNVILPLGSLVYVLFCTFKSGWGWDNFMAEANTGKGAKIKNWMKGYMKYVLPILVLIVFVIGIITFQFK